MRGCLCCGRWCHALVLAARLYHDLARGVTYLDGGGHRATGHIHDGDVLRALIRDVGGAPICTDGEPMRVGAYPYCTVDCVVCRIKEGEGPWSLADDKAGAAVREHQNMMG